MANILICDDEQDIVNALKIYLNDPDYVLFEAHNGKEAVETVRDNEIHLVLLDIMMPIMNGIEAMSQIRGFSNVPQRFTLVSTIISPPFSARGRPCRCACCP